MNAPTKITLDFETVAEAMRREGVAEIRDWRPVGSENAFSVRLRDGRYGCGRTIRAAIEQATAKASVLAA